MSAKAERIKALHVSLREAFTWEDTPDGSDYWMNVYKKLGELEDIERKKSELVGVEMVYECAVREGFIQPEEDES